MSIMKPSHQTLNGLFGLVLSISIFTLLGSAEAKATFPTPLKTPEAEKPQPMRIVDFHPQLFWNRPREGK